MGQLQPWFWRLLPLSQRTGTEVFERLFLPPPNPWGGKEAIATLLESASAHEAPRSPLARYSICAGKPRTSAGQPHYWTAPIGAAFNEMRSRLVISPTMGDAPVALPFTGGWLGWLSYDIAREIEQFPSLNPERLPFPASFWYEPECFAVLDHYTQELWLAVTHAHQLNDLEHRLRTSHPPIPDAEHSPPVFQAVNPIFETSQAQFEACVRQAKEYIHAGDIFQTNLSLRFHVTTPAHPWQLYRSLQHVNPSPFASYWQTPWGAVVSCSPERLVKLHPDDRVETRPIAGTRPRGTTPEGDRHLAAELLANEKERAEHIMLVDLERNDLGRVCQWGTVHVNELLSVEYYSHVMHLVSNVMGRVAPHYNAVDVLQAIFPGGTITGCPKVRSMEIIEELEPVRRSLFYGSCGYIDARGSMDLNILIRTLLMVPAPNPAHPATVWGQVGAGIVADSDPHREWLESLQKAQAQLIACGLSNLRSP